MWIYTQHGFASIVFKQGNIQVRTRRRADIERFAELVDENVEILYTPNNDYLYRIKIDHDQFAKMMARMAYEVQYSNFKNHISKGQTQSEKDAYYGVYNATWKMDEGRQQDPLYAAVDKQSSLFSDYAHADIFDAEEEAYLAEIEALEAEYFAYKNQKSIEHDKQVEAEENTSWLKRLLTKKGTG